MLQKILNKPPFKQFLKGENSKEVFSKTLQAGLLLGLGAALQFVFNIVVARSLGAKEAGTFFLAFTLLSITAMISRFGLDQSAVKFIAPLYTQKNFSALNGLKNLILKIILVSNLFLGLLLFIGSNTIAEKVFNDPGLGVQIKIVSFILPFFSLSFIFNEILRGLKKIKEAVFIKQVSIYALSILFIVALSRYFNDKVAIISVLAASVLTATAGYILVRKFTPAIKPTPFNISILFRTSLPLLVVALSMQILEWSDVLILGAYRDSSEVGIYTVALRTGFIISFVLQAVNTISAPVFADLYSQGKLVQLGDLVKSLTRIMAAATLPVLLLFLLLPELILSIFGPEFREASVALVIIAIGQYINVALGSVGYLLSMTGHERPLALTVALVGFMNIVLNLILIPIYGFVGAAIATSVSIAVQNISLFIIVYKKLGIHAYYGKIS